jgi:hypothetical protein
MAFNYSRFNNRRVFTNRTSGRQLARRGTRFIRQYNTPTMNYPSTAEMRDLTVQQEFWGVGTKFYKLAHKYYNDSSLWWIIAWFNKKPLESDFSNGDLVLIPLPLVKVLDIFEG